MHRSFRKLYRIDTVPIGLKLPLWMYGYSVATVLWLYYALVRHTSKIEISGTSELRNRDNFLYCLWHEQWHIYFAVVHLHRKHAWMNHPYWYMYPVYVFLKFVGVHHQILGSSGSGGKEAADKLLEYLNRGYSTVIAPDGPAGPPKKLKNGILLLSARTGIPVVPMQFECSRFVTLPSWDGKKLPLPFSRIRVIFGKPISVNPDRLSEAEAQIANQLQKKEGAETPSF